VKNVIKWIKKHLRPYVKYQVKEGEAIDLKKDDFHKVVRKVKEQTEVGIKFTFKF